jgi:hypothetical protein
MKRMNNEKGIALVTALMLTLISLTIVLTLLYLVNQGITTTASQKRYRNSLEAAHGGIDVFAREVIPGIITAINANPADPSTAVANTVVTLKSRFTSIGLDFSSGDCIRQKLTLPASQWTACSAPSMTTDPKQGFDATFVLKGTSSMSTGYKVFTKIVDTTPGNSDATGIDYLDSGSGVTGSSSGLSPKHLPGLYRMEVQGEKETNPKEKALLSVLYAY